MFLKIIKIASLLLVITLSLHLAQSLSTTTTTPEETSIIHHLLSTILNPLSTALYLVTSHHLTKSPATPPQLIIDTDFFSDCDDVSPVPMSGVMCPAGCDAQTPKLRNDRPPLLQWPTSSRVAENQKCKCMSPPEEFKNPQKVSHQL
jgi:hypothetical protein